MASSVARADRTLTWVLALASAAALALVFGYVIASGTWLDEYWQLWISGAPASALVERLANDTHPPWFNLLGRAILWLTGSEILPARLVNVTLALATLAGGLCVLRGLPANLRWRIFLLLIASGGTVGLATLGSSFRVYAWLLVLAGLQGAILTAAVLERPVPALLVAVITAASVGTHYGHAAGAIAIALVTIARSWRDNRALAWTVAIGVGAGALCDVGFALVQMPHWQAHSNVGWAEKGPGAALSSFAAVFTDDLLFNFVAALLVVLAAARGAPRPLGWMLAPLVLAGIAWLVLSPVMPIVPRYLPSTAAILAVAGALAWQELRLHPALDAGVALMIALQPLVFGWARPPLPGWEVGARAAAAIVHDCPETAVYAIPAGRFSNDPDGALSRFETPVINLAYTRVGQKLGLSPQTVTSPTRIRASRCPAIVWMESAHGIERVPPAAVLRRARLEPPADSKTRFIPTPNGALLLISSADRLQRQP